MSAVVRAEQAVTEAAAELKDALYGHPADDRLIDALVRAVEARCMANVHAEPLPDFPPGEDPGVVARTVRSMDLRAIRNGGTSDLLM